MLCFTAKPLIFFQADIFFYICPKLSEQQQLFLGSWARGIEPATRKGLALTGFPGNAKIPDPDGSFSNNCSWVLRRRDDYPGHCLRFMSRLAYDLEYLYHGKAGNLKQHNQHKRWGCGCFSPTITHEEPYFHWNFRDIGPERELCVIYAQTTCYFVEFPLLRYMI